MSKLDREISAVIDDAGSQGQVIVPKLFSVMMNDELSENEITDRVEELLKDLKPKTYDVYVSDMKNVFRQNGWKEPKI